MNHPLTKLLFMASSLALLACSENTGPVDPQGGTDSLKTTRLVINEFIPRNKAVGSPTPNFLDEAGKYSDWIELYNAGEEAVQLSDYYLSDSRDSLYNFTLYDTLLEPGAYYTLFASGETVALDPFTGDTTGVFLHHAPFKLSFTCGDELFLIRKSDSVQVDSVVFDNGSDIYKNLISNESYGRYPDGGDEWMPMAGASPDSATPNAANLPNYRSESDDRLTPDRWNEVDCAEDTTNI